MLLNICIERYTFPKDPRGFFTVGKVRNQVLVLEFRFFHLLYFRCSRFWISERAMIPRSQLRINHVFKGHFMVNNYTHPSTLSWLLMRPLVKLSAISGKCFLHGHGNTKTDAPSSPLHTPHGQGVKVKPPNVQFNHVILHSTEIPPSKQGGEIHMTRDPIAVKTLPPVRLYEYCRADLGAVYPISYNQRVREMGVVKARSLEKLLRYPEEIHESGERGRRWRITKPTPDTGQEE